MFLNFRYITSFTTVDSSSVLSNTTPSPTSYKRSKREIVETSTLEPTTTEAPEEEFDFIEQLANLQFCTVYNVTVLSEGFENMGVSETLSTEAITLQPAEIGGPTDIMISEIDTTSAIISWSAPDNHQRCIYNYEVYWQSELANDDGSINVNSFTKSLLLEELKPCTKYQISVRAWTAGDIYGESKTIELVTQDVNPEAPENLIVSNVDQHGFLAKWCPPRENPQCARVWDWNTRENYNPPREHQRIKRSLEDPEPAEPTDPTEPTEPTEPTQPTTKPTVPTTQPTAPTTKPTQPTTTPEPTQTTTKPTQPTTTTEDPNGCQVDQQEQLKCGTEYTFTVWAYSPTGLEGEKKEIQLVTQEC